MRQMPNQTWICLPQGPATALVVDLLADSLFQLWLQPAVAITGVLRMTSRNRVLNIPSSVVLAFISWCHGQSETKIQEDRAFHLSERTEVGILPAPSDSAPSEPDGQQNPGR